MLYLRTKGRYEAVHHARPDGVPSEVLFTLHMRESDNSFNRHLHEGSALTARTRFVPKNRPPPPAQPPFDWVSSAIDAVYSADYLNGPWSDVTWSINRAESYNGMFYSKHGLPSPYIWAGTNSYGPPEAAAGKFVSDGRFSRTTVDQQNGCAAVWLRMRQRGIKLQFDP